MQRGARVSQKLPVVVSWGLFTSVVDDADNITDTVSNSRIHGRMDGWLDGRLHFTITLLYLILRLPLSPPPQLIVNNQCT